MVNVNVTVYKDINGVCINGYPRAVSSDSVVYTVEKVYMTNAPVGTCIGELLPVFMDLLKIVDPNLGIMWIDETPSSFAALIGNASGAAGDRTTNTTFTATTTNQTQVIAATIGATAILFITVSGVPVSSSLYSFTPSTGTWVFDASVPIVPTVEIFILFNA